MQEFLAIFSIFSNFINFLIDLIDEFLLGCEHFLFVVFFQDLYFPCEIYFVFHLIHFHCFFHSFYQELAFFVANVHQVACILPHRILELDSFLHVVFSLFLKVILIILVERFHFQCEIFQLSIRIQIGFLTGRKHLIQLIFDACVLLHHHIFQVFVLNLNVIFYTFIMLVYGFLCVDICLFLRTIDHLFHLDHYIISILFYLLLHKFLILFLRQCYHLNQSIKFFSECVKFIVEDRDDSLNTFFYFHRHRFLNVSH